MNTDPRSLVATGLAAVALAAASTILLPGSADAAPTLVVHHVALPDPLGSVCDGDPDLTYRPNRSYGGQLGEGMCRVIVDKTGRAIGKAGSAVGGAAKKCAENTLVGAAAEALTEDGSASERAKRLTKLGKKIAPAGAAIECAHDVVR